MTSPSKYTRKIIGIGYKKFRGKDSLADCLVDDHGFLRVSFAKKLKEAAKIIFGFTDEQLTDPVLKETPDEFWGFSPRFALQGTGDGLRKHVDPLVWIKAAFRFSPDEEAKDVVVSDVRYLNELNTVKEYGGVAVRMDREIEESEDDELAKHVSEVELDNYHDWDMVVDNNGPQELLKSAADVLVLGYEALRTNDKTIVMVPWSREVMEAIDVELKLTPGD